MYKLLITYILFIVSGISLAQEKILPQIIDQPTNVDPAEYFGIESIAPDSILSLDSIEVDSATATVIEAPIDYNAEDSIVVSFDGQKVYLYNNSMVTYQSIELKAYYIELDLETKEVFAEGFTDTTGAVIGAPEFKDGQEEFKSKTLRYNFETQKGLITDVVTEQGEGTIHGEITKKISGDTFLMKNGKYSTCDADHPHFYLHLTKAKVISNDKTITGPAWLVLEDFPIYFPVLPFGYFPNSTTYSSGVLIPSYGEEENRGFFLREGGYYWAAGEYFDLAVRGDIYSKGSWATKLHTNYKLKYKFSGNFDFRYAVNKYGEKEFTDVFTRTPQFQVTWSHSQDAKANPNRTFSASVNFSTSGYDKMNSLSAQNYLRTQKSSSISYTKRWENSPFSMSANMRHSQNSTDTTISLSLPEMTFTMQKIYPFKKKKRVGKIKWYEKFGFNYSGNFRNSITSKESELLEKSLITDWKNGIKHNIPISLPNFNLFKYINVSPSFGYNEKWYFSSLNQTYDPENEYYDPIRREYNNVRTDTVRGLKRIYSYNYSLSASTNIYGMYKPKSKNSRIDGIRHKMTPSLSFSYNPDFGKEKYGYWQTVQVDSTGHVEEYDVFTGGIYGGAPSRGASGAISLNVTNNLEMKVLDMKDTTDTAADSNTELKYKKVKILDNLSFGTSYNLIADSLNLSPINIRGRTTIKGVSINFGTTLNPYATDSLGRIIHKYMWSQSSGLAKLGRLTRANLSFGMSFKSKKGEKESEENRQAVEEEQLLPGDYSNYVDFNIPWDIRFNYNFNYSRTNPYEKGRFTQTLSLNGSASLTKNIRLSMNTNYDIMAGEFSFTTLNITRDLHCWQMSFNFVPFGYMKSYSFTINAKSTLLKDLKLDKRRSYYDKF